MKYLDVVSWALNYGLTKIIQLEFVLAIEELQKNVVLLVLSLCNNVS